jgi:hypothetical protein
VQLREYGHKHWDDKKIVYYQTPMEAQQLLLFDVSNFEQVLKGSVTDEPTYMSVGPTNHLNRIEKGEARLQRCSNTHL